MSETHLQRATVLFFVGGVIALLFGLWPLTLTLLVVAFVLYARRDLERFSDLSSEFPTIERLTQLVG